MFVLTRHQKGMKFMKEVGRPVLVSSEDNHSVVGGGSAVDPDNL